MPISMFSTHVSPICIDFGTAHVRMLQVSMGERPTLVAAAQLDVPDNVRTDARKRIEFLNDALPRAIRRNRFKGRRVAFSIPSARTFVTHIAVPGGKDVPDDYVGMHMHAQTGVPASNLVIRTTNVKDINNDGSTVTETICFGVPREVVMQHIEALKRAKLEVTGVHTEQHALVWAFNHIHRRKGDDQITNLFVDLGWNATKVAISHGRSLVFSKQIPIGGRHFDQQLADTLHCDIQSARAHRLSSFETLIPASCRGRVENTTGSAILDTGMALANRSADHNAHGNEDIDHAGSAMASGHDERAGATSVIAEDRRNGASPSSLCDAGSARGSIAPEGVDFTDLFESIVDELKMCVRYHRALFEDRPLDRLIFAGGEAQHTELCRGIASSLSLPALVADPIARIELGEAQKLDVFKGGRVQPGWTVACGLWSGLED